MKQHEFECSRSKVGKREPTTEDLGQASDVLGALPEPWPNLYVIAPPERLRAVLRARRRSPLGACLGCFGGQKRE